MQILAKYREKRKEEETSYLHINKKNVRNGRLKYDGSIDVDMKKNKQKRKVR